MVKELRVRKHARRLLLVFAVAALGSCATVPKQAYNKVANKDLHVLCILEPVTSKDYRVENIGHIGLGFGLIGGLIAIADMNAKTSEFTAAAKATGLDLGLEYRTALISAVERVGYEVKVLNVERPKQAYLPAYDDLDARCDIYFDSALYGGYMSASGTADYIPMVRVAVRAVKRTTKDIVYQENVAYGYEFRGGQAIAIASDAKYRFKDHQALMANIGLAVDGLRSGIPAVVGQFSRDLAP